MMSMYFHIYNVSMQLLCSLQYYVIIPSTTSLFLRFICDTSLQVYKNDKPLSVFMWSCGL